MSAKGSGMFQQSAYKQHKNIMEEAIKVHVIDARMA